MDTTVNFKKIGKSIFPSILRLLNVQGSMLDTRTIIFLVEGVSPYLANYMTMALDPNVGHLVSFMREEIPNYDQGPML
jgi:hypothetical protein